VSYSVPQVRKPK